MTGSDSSISSLYDVRRTFRDSLMHGFLVALQSKSKEYYFFAIQ